MTSTETIGAQNLLKKLSFLYILKLNDLIQSLYEKKWLINLSGSKKKFP